MNVEMLAVHDAAARLRAGARLIDIREPDEYAREHIVSAQLVSLSALEKGARLQAWSGETVIFYCQSGARTSGNATRLAALGSPATVCLLSGGLQAWKQAGLPTEEDSSAPLPLMRQVQIAAGSLVLGGVVLGYTVSDVFYLLSGAAGGGLIFAGLTGFCGMARLLQRMPWNTRKHGSRAS